MSLPARDGRSPSGLHSHANRILDASRPSFGVASIALALLVVGLLDHVTGADVHLFALYFIPLTLAGAWYGVIGAWTSALAATSIWSGMQNIGNPVHGRLGAWCLNFLIQGAAFLVVALLVATLVERLKRERHEARHDALTGLANRTALFCEGATLLALCHRYQRPISLIYLDLDNFKRANDTFGHAQGDLLLARCGELVRGAMRTSDLAVRLGGDEFVLLLPETGTEDARALALRLSTAIASAAECAAAGVTASIGIASETCARSSLSDLLQEADAVMYQCKRASKSRSPAASETDTSSVQSANPARRIASPTHG